MPGEYRAVWTVPGGGTGYSVFHHSIIGLIAGAQGFADAVHDFFDDIKATIPNDVSINFESEVLELNDVTGALEAVYTITPPAAVAGTATGDWMGGAGYRVDWDTGVVVGGHRLRGRTYIVPSDSVGFDADGTPGSTLIGLANTAAATYIATVAGGAGHPVIWSRTHGTSEEVSGGSVANKSAILRSRRD